MASIQKHSNGHWKAIGESNMTPHGLRHAAASLAIALSTAMVDHPYIRHATARMTLDLYGHLFPDQLDDVADRLDAIGRAAAQNSCGQSAVNRETRPLRPPAGASDKPLTLRRCRWARPGSNRRQPRCKRGALPAELQALAPMVMPPRGVQKCARRHRPQRRSADPSMARSCPSASR